MATMQFRFENKKIVVTGGARGIGFEIAHQFLLSGATVNIWDQSPERLEQARIQLASFGARVLFTQVDVSSLASCETAAQTVTFDLDILVNNAGITRDKTLANLSGEDFDQVVNTNLGGVFYVTKALLAKFSAGTAPKRIINLASVVAHNGNFGQTNYVAAKAGVIGMTKTWARELARKGFTSNAIAPGFTLTPMVEAMPKKSRDRMVDKIPTGRLGQPLDIANACLFLASDEAAYVNGTVLCVDGGLVV